MEQEVSTCKALNCAVVNSGCTSNVIGINWLRTAILTHFQVILPYKRDRVEKTFQFGPSKSCPSLNPLRAADFSDHLSLSMEEFSQKN